MLAGSDPTSGSVRAKAESAPPAARGRYFRFCCSVPKRTSGVGTPMDWCAERKAAVEPHREATSASARL